MGTTVHYPHSTILTSSLESVGVGGSHSAKDDSVMQLMHSHKISHLRERTERERSFGDLARFHGSSSLSASIGDVSSSVSAPTSPLKMCWGQGDRHVGPPERSMAAPHSSSEFADMHADLGLVGDVVLPSLPLRATSFGGSGGGPRESSFDPLDEYIGRADATPPPDPMGASYDSVGVNSTWRSVPDDMNNMSLAQDANYDSTYRARAVSTASSTSSPPRRSRTTSEDKYGIQDALPTYCFCLTMIIFCLCVLAVGSSLWILLMVKVSSECAEYANAHSVDADSDGCPSGRSGSLPRNRVCWTYGATSLVGNRSSNEDRCVAVSDLYSTVSEFMKSMAAGSCDIPAFYGSDRGTGWCDMARPSRSCGVGAFDDAYFAVYDGHSGQYVSQHLQTILHHSIYTYELSNH